MKCAGAETQLPENEMDADDENWIKVDWCVINFFLPGRELTQR